MGTILIIYQENDDNSQRKVTISPENRKMVPILIINQGNGNTSHREPDNGDNIHQE